MEQLLALLKKYNLKITTAESCTGGMLGAAITAVSGASACYETGFITYSNAAKERLLGVRHETLAAFGAVSAQTAAEMAEGALKAGGADVSISVTGIAGPTGGSAEKPVGLVYIGVAGAHGVEVTECRFSGSRAQVRSQTVAKAAAKAAAYIQKFYS